MPVFLLKMNPQLSSALQERFFGFDSYQGFVIRADNEIRARMVVEAYVRDGQTGAIWLDSEYTLCEEIQPYGETKIILSDYVQG